MDAECGRVWTRKFMSCNLTKSFLSGAYKEHCEQVLYDTERVMFPATQIIMENENNIRRLSDEIQKLKSEFRRRLHELEIEYRRALYPRVNHEDNKERAAVVNPCIYDDCRGYMSSQWKCGLCERYACAKCHQPKTSRDDEEHTCNPEDVLSVDAIRRETTPCPKCHTKIYKIYGCDQMWCTSCNTAFSWKTGRVITGSIHNPHYFEYMARTQQTAPTHVVNGCGNERMPQYIPSEVSIMIDTTLGKHSPESQRLKMILRYIHHIRAVELHHQTPRATPDVNLDKRKEYLSNRITEDDFRRQALSRMKANQRLTEVRQVVDMIYQTLCDIYHRMCEYITRNLSINIKADVLVSFVTEMDGVCDYANECIQDINRAYSSTSKMTFNRDFYYDIHIHR